VRRCAALAFAFVGLAGSAPAAEEAPRWPYELAGELMSPFCPGATLAECTSQDAQTLRMWMVVQAAAGRSREEVEAELLARYGESMLAAPRPRGMGLAAYAIPVVAFMAGGGLLSLFLRRSTARVSAQPAPAGPAPLDAELARRVEEDLAR
jgi:cytochrome c-type biogenesis protein CcmH/NrfF